MQLNFRVAGENDTDVISTLAKKIWYEHYPDIITVEQINYMLSSRYSASVIQKQMQGNENYYLAFAGNEPVAYASVELKGDHYYLHKFYVDVARHRGGIGAQFFDFIMQQIDTSKPIRLQVNRQNIKAVNFYFKQGFVIELAADFDIGGGYFMNDFVMIKKP